MRLPAFILKYTVKFAPPKYRCFERNRILDIDTVFLIFYQVAEELKK